MVILKSADEIALMRKAGNLNARALEAVKQSIRPQVTTLELDAIADDYIRSRGGVPTFFKYRGFPASICTSVNEQVVHGIPGGYALKEGDIVSVDIGASLGGWQGDMADTYPVGEVSEEKLRLIRVTRECFYEALKFATIGNRISDLSHAVQSHAENNGYSVVRDLVGHGIGQEMHEDPEVPNFGAPGHGMRLREGMTLAVEPMINMGGWQVVTRSDGWTCVTRDGKPSAHYEHTIAILKSGPAILTQL